MFNVVVGKNGLKYTWQKPFDEEVKCKFCNDIARLAFVVFEQPSKKIENETFVCDLHKNDPNGEGYWLHDCCAVAVYFCKKCFEPIAVFNQG